MDQYFHAAVLTAKREETDSTTKPRKRRSGECAKEAGDSNSRGDSDFGVGAQNAESGEQDPPTAATNEEQQIYMGDFQQAQNKSERKVLPQSLLKETDAKAREYGQALVHQSDREYHRAYFKDGISSVASRQGHEERMVLFLFLILFSSSMFDTYKTAFGSEERLSLYVLVLSHLIMIEDFMKRDSILRSEVDLLQKYMPKFMEMFKRATDRTKGMGMNIIKFHLLLHLPQDMLRFGPSTGYDSSFCESMHKVYKLDARRTQKRTDDSFQYQTAKRSCERIAISCGMRALRHTDALSTVSAPTPPTVKVRGRCFTLPNGNGALPNGDEPPLPINERRFFKEMDLQRKLQVFSTADIYGTLYHSKWWLARHDWAYVNWEDWGIVVARFKCFFQLQPSEECYCPHTDTTFKGPGSFALVEAFTQNYNEAPPDDMSIENFQAHSASSLLFRMDVSRQENEDPQLFVVDLYKMVEGPAAVVPFDISQELPLQWLVLAPKWERHGVFQDSMRDLIAKARKRK